MRLSTLLIKYILHKGVESKQNNCTIEDHCELVEEYLKNARELTGTATSKDGQNYGIIAFNFKTKRYKNCKLVLGVDAIPLERRTNFLIIENLDIPLILYHEPS